VSGSTSSASTASGSTSSTSGYYAGGGGSTGGGGGGSTGGYVGGGGGSSGGYYGGGGGSSGGYYGGGGGSSGGYYSSGSDGYTSVSGNTKDTDLQRAALQSQQIEDRAQGLASQFSMNIDAARQLTQISDKMAVLSSQTNGMTADDQASLMEAALGVVGITNEQVTGAVAAYGKGDKSAINGLVGQAAVNLGMPSDAGLRETILPSIGINLGQ
jgi:hypothetical protein